jgi:hypothetical protein
MFYCNILTRDSIKCNVPAALIQYSVTLIILLTRFYLSLLLALEFCKFCVGIVCFGVMLSTAFKYLA